MFVGLQSLTETSDRRRVAPEMKFVLIVSYSDSETKVAGPRPLIEFSTRELYVNENVWVAMQLF